MARRKDRSWWGVAVVLGLGLISLAVITLMVPRRAPPEDAVAVAVERLCRRAACDTRGGCDGCTATAYQYHPPTQFDRQRGISEIWCIRVAGVYLDPAGSWEETARVVLWGGTWGSDDTGCEVNAPESSPEACISPPLLGSCHRRPGAWGRL